MHCEKNICENIFKTVLGSKDSYGSRQDMEELRIRSDLWLEPPRTERDLFSLPKAPYILTPSKRTTVLEIIKDLKSPSNYVGAIAKCVEEGKLRYMKSHDFHVLMQQVSVFFLYNLIDISQCIKKKQVKILVLTTGVH
jgi:hypothetical protein